MKFTPLNPIIDVGKDIYCQHDANNETIFPVKKSGEKYTKVYKIIIPTITAGKMWLKNATLVDCPPTPPIGATNKDNYIPVNEGEQYFFRIYGLNNNGSVPILFLDEKDNYVQHFFHGTYTTTKQGVELTVPAGAKKMHITSYGSQSLSIQKIINMTDYEIDTLCINENSLLEKINNTYKEYINNPIVYKKINKAYLTFVLEDGRMEIEEYINLFIEKGIPLSFATSSENLKNPEIYIDTVYNHPRTSLFSYDNNFEKMKEGIDKIIEQQNYLIINFHSGINGTLVNLSKLLDYVKQKEKEGKIDIGNYKEFYEKNAIRLNDIIKDKHTYYVSSDGKSKDGLSENDPMNYESLNLKQFITGDKILFKRGDTFYGKLIFKNIIVDDNVLTLSSYGDPKKGKPILTCYKIVNKKESWEKESDNIYRIDLTNLSKFKGLNDTTPEGTSIGFMETKNKTKYYNLKKTLSELTEAYDFCSNGTYFFVRTNGATPYEELGELKLAPRIKILILHSNVKVENLHIQGTGAHA
jgi:flagellar biosynthesis chaperone FliJ